MKFYTILLVSLIWGSLSMAEKTVCSITINSSDEIRAAKSQLTGKGFRFVELTNYGDDWFKQSCKKKIQCDVLLISGHFAGTFFGDSNKSLSISEIESASCSSECDGILKKPKEVFLFGCNTLAGKKQDHRTPEVYRNVLLRDGFSHAQAEQIVAFRYSPIGINFSTRMSHIFRETPSIYGFNSTSPLGHITGPMFRNYLKSQGPEQYSDYLDRVKPESNPLMLKAFRGTSITHVVGREYSDQKVFPACVLSDSNKTLSRVEKLQWIQSELAGPNQGEVITYLSEFLKTQAWAKKWNSMEKEIIAEIGKNETLREMFSSIMSMKNSWMKRTQSEALELMLALRIINEDQQKRMTLDLLDLNNPRFGDAEMQYICGLKVQVHINPRHINENQWRNEYFRYAIKCLMPPGTSSSELWRYLDRYEGGN